MADLVDIWSSHSPNEDMVAHVARFEHGYPPVNIQKAIEHGHRNSEFSHEK